MKLNDFENANYFDMTNFFPLEQQEKIYVSVEEQQKVMDFSVEINNANKIKLLTEERNAILDKIVKQHFYGKLAEGIFNKWIEKNVLGFENPEFSCDLRDHEKLGLSAKQWWEADIPCFNRTGFLKNFHVKSCCEHFSETKLNDDLIYFGWVFQFSNQSGYGGKDRLFIDGWDKSNETIVLTVIKHGFVTEGNYGRVCAVIPWLDIPFDLFHEPEVARHRGKKKCLKWQAVERYFGNLPKGV